MPRACLTAVPGLSFRGAFWCVSGIVACLLPARESEKGIKQDERLSVEALSSWVDWTLV